MSAEAKMREMTSQRKQARIKPYNIDNFVELLIQIEFKHKGDPKAFLEETLELHEYIVERYRRLYEKFKNPSHIWSCINDLAAISSVYFYMSNSENYEFFLKPLPDWVLEYIALSAIKIHTLVLSAQNAAERWPKSPPPPKDRRIKIKPSDAPQKEKTQAQIEKSDFSKKIMAKIPKALALAKQGRNTILSAGSQRRDLFEIRKYLLAGLPSTATAEILKMRRRPELLSDPENTANGEALAELQRFQQKTRDIYNIWGVKIVKPPSTPKQRAGRAKKSKHQ